MTTDSDGITFEIDGIARGQSGLLEVSGRWYGVRGRRFVRPTLTVTLPEDGGEVRMLADLAHKPWAAEEGDPWRAGFAFEGEVNDVVAAELNVAPDITVQLGAPGAGTARSRAAARAASPSAATGARTPVIRDNPARPRPRVPRTAEVQRLHERLAAAEAATTKERNRREAADAALEQERGTMRKLQAELARLRAERELAETVQAELDTASASLDGLRRDLRELGSERDEIRAQRDEAQQALTVQRAETERLRGQLADAEAAVRRLTQAGREARTGAAETPRAPVARAAVRSPQASPASARGPAPATAGDDGDGDGGGDDGDPVAGAQTDDVTERMPFPVTADGGPGVERGVLARSGPDRSARGAPERSGPDRGALAAPVRSDRPLNPSLRGPNWIGRGIALVVLIIVIIALVLLISSTGH
ncbi:MAG TPA: hypothetical protein VFN55_07490 [Solirubrobacteraceae bacterium]|nr:hypothetical protein [Solirubrobacteraceae bacterium]